MPRPHTCRQPAAWLIQHGPILRKLSWLPRPRRPRDDLLSTSTRRLSSAPPPLSARPSPPTRLCLDFFQRAAPQAVTLALRHQVFRLSGEGARWLNYTAMLSSCSQRSGTSLLLRVPILTSNQRPLSATLCKGCRLSGILRRSRSMVSPPMAPAY